MTSYDVYSLLNERGKPSTFSRGCDWFRCFIVNDDNARRSRGYSQKEDIEDC